MDAGETPAHPGRMRRHAALPLGRGARREAASDEREGERATGSRSRASTKRASPGNASLRLASTVAGESSACAARGPLCETASSWGAMLRFANEAERATGSRSQEDRQTSPSLPRPRSETRSGERASEVVPLPSSHHGGGDRHRPSTAGARPRRETRSGERASERGSAPQVSAPTSMRRRAPHPSRRGARREAASERAPTPSSPHPKPRKERRGMPECKADRPLRPEATLPGRRGSQRTVQRRNRACIVVPGCSGADRLLCQRIA